MAGVKGKSGRPKAPPKAKELLKSIIPLEDIFEDDEIEIYRSLVDVYLADFDTDELSSGDMDDIYSLARNKVLELRLLKSSKGSADKQIDISTAIEKINKQSEKLKESLLTRRKDRVDPNQYKGFSIVDLAVAFDLDKRRALEKKAKKLKEEQKRVLESREGYVGNKLDRDAKGSAKEDEEDD